MRPTITATDWKHQPLPERHVSLPLDFHLDAVESACVRRGLLPLDMEDKWFLYYEGTTLHMHRSWTGFCIAQVHLIPEGEGLHAVSAEINRDPTQYTSSDDAADVALVESMVRGIGTSQRYIEQRQAGDHGWLVVTQAGPH